MGRGRPDGNARQHANARPGITRNGDAEGIKHLSKEQQETAKKLHLKLDYDFNGEAYYTVSGQNSNNSVRIPNKFFKALDEDGDWQLTWRTNGKIAKTIKAR